MPTPSSPARPVTADPARALLLTILVLVALLGSAVPASGAQQGPDPVGVWPLQPEPEVVRAFDPPDDPYGAGHRGVDLTGRLGQPVRAALPGTVTFAGSLAGRGVVVVSHGPTRTTYEPVTASVSTGDVVAAGAVIGVLQVSSSHCFPAACLHWGWIEGDTYLDPLRLVGGGPVRLLPLWRDGPVGGPAGGSAVSVAPRVAALRSALPYAGWVTPLAGQARGWAWR